MLLYHHFNSIINLKCCKHLCSQEHPFSSDFREPSGRKVPIGAQVPSAVRRVVGAALGDAARGAARPEPRAPAGRRRVDGAAPHLRHPRAGREVEPEEAEPATPRQQARRPPQERHRRPGHRARGAALARGRAQTQPRRPGATPGTQTAGPAEGAPEAAQESGGAARNVVPQATASLHVHR